MENRKWEGYWRLGNNHGFRREENACISTPIVEGGRDLKVSHIIDPSTIFGTIISLANCFCQKMPMQFLESPSYQWYKRILEFGHWIKTICTLYQVLIILIMKKFVNYDDMIAEGDWKFRLEWSCFWRLCRNLLRTRDRLRTTRGVSCPIICPLSNTNVESTAHIFAMCHVNSGC